MEDTLIKRAIRPKIYAYTTPQYKETEWKGEKSGKGLLKIGYTEKDVTDRIWDQFPTKTPEKQPFQVLLEEEAVDIHGHFFNDHLLHKKLEEKGFYDKLCAQASRREKEASDAERGSIKYKQVEYMSYRVGEDTRNLFKKT
jgi:hypothetical protein